MANKFKTYFISLLTILAFVQLSFKDDSNTHQQINFNAGWKFKLLDANSNGSKEFAVQNYNDANWENVSLPHTANVEPLVVNNQWQGICWYRKDFDRPKNSDDKKVFLTLEAAMNYSEIWINGSLIKTHQGGYLPIIIDLTSYLKKEKNRIAIRLDNTDNLVTGPKPLKILDFNMYGGLYRNAFLTVENKVHITDPNFVDKVAGGGIFVTYPKVSTEESLVKIKTNVSNDQAIPQTVEVFQKIYDKDKLVLEQKSSPVKIETLSDNDFESTISIQNAKLWSPKSPHLYRLETTVYVNGVEVDKQDTRFGIRKFEFKNDDFYLNGEKTFLRGVNRHQEYPFIGYALSDNAQYREAKKIKDGGFDYIRLSHYPQSPAFLNACDELGLLVADAIMGWQYYGDNDAFRNYCYTSAKQLIRRDRNHASVLAWEVSLNETKMPIFFMEELDKIVHHEYPGDNAFSCGWMDDVYDIYFQARQHRLLHDDEQKKDKPYAVSEYGDWEYYSNNAGLNQDKLPKNIRLERSSRQFRGDGEVRLLQQLDNVVEAHNDNFSTKAFADSYWVMYDYNRGYHDDIEASGLMDIFRLPKFAYYFYQSQRNSDEKVVLNIATYWDKNSPLNVKVLSNCDEVKLYLNNDLVATQKPDVNKNTKNLGHPPFTFNIATFKAGTLKAVGYINGNQVISQEVKTPETPKSLKIWIDESGKKPQFGKNDAVFVYITAVDNNGTIIPDFNGDIKIETKGDVKIMNLGAIRAEAGIATALVKLGDRKAKVKITASADNLKSKTIKIK